MKIVLDMPKMATEDRGPVKIDTVEQLLYHAVMNGIGKDFDKFFPDKRSMHQATVEMTLNGSPMDVTSYFQYIVDIFKGQWNEFDQLIQKRAVELLQSKLGELTTAMLKVVDGKDEWERQE